MEFIRKENSLLLVIDNDGERDCLWDFHNDNSIETDNAMYDFFESILANTEWEWINPEEIGALTDAPILGIKDENENVIEAYGFMDYAVKSLMVELFVVDKAELQKG